jgi:AcrB/AcrD/AcrF family
MRRNRRRNCPGGPWAEWQSGAFIAFPLLGFSVNTLTLFGHVLAVGIFVDDAIVSPKPYSIISSTASVHVRRQ